MRGQARRLSRLARGSDDGISLAKVRGRADTTPEGPRSLELLCRLDEPALGHELPRRAEPELGLERLLPCRVEDVCRTHEFPGGGRGAPVTPGPCSKPSHDRVGRPARIDQGEDELDMEVLRIAHRFVRRDAFHQLVEG